MPKKILHLADLHIGSAHGYLGKEAAARAREADGVLERIAAWAIGPSAPELGAVLIAGDLFDNPYPSTEQIDRAIRPIETLVAAGIQVITLPGNHDEWTYPDGVYRARASIWPGRLVSEREPRIVAEIDLAGVTAEVVSCAFQQGRNPEPSQWKSPFATERAADSRRIGLFHGTLVDRLGRFIAEGPRAFAIEIDQLARWGIDYLALGHIHRRQIHKSERGSCLALYPGPVEGLGFSDPGARVLSLVDLSGPTPVLEPIDAVPLGIRTCDFSTLEIESVGLSGPDELDRRIEAEASGSQSAKFLRVILRGRPGFPIDAAETVRRHAPRFRGLEVSAEAPAAALGDWEPLAAQRTLEGAFVARLLAAREADSDPARRAFWDRVAEEGLRALRGEGS